MITVSLLVAAVAVTARPMKLPGRTRPTRSDSPLELAFLLRVGLSAGLSLARSLHLAAEHVDPDTAQQIRRVERQGLIAGLTEAMATVSSDRARLFQVLADAHLSGAPILFAINAFIADESERARTDALHEARVLPVRLTIPVALGLLPGFVLLTIAPQVALALRDLLSQVVGL